MGSQSTAVDQSSGLSTQYTAAQDNTLSWNALTSPNPMGENAEPVHLHPFPSLKVLYKNLGATLSIDLGGTRS